jgi:hypothetical protein
VAPSRRRAAGEELTPGLLSPGPARAISARLPQNAAMLSGSCQCASVRFEVAERPTSPTACHCVQCRKQSGHFFASANVPKAALTVSGAEHLSWYRSSEKVRRGFCSRCGSWLFWEPVFRDWTSIALGAFDGPTQLELERHIFVAEKGDYYELGDGLPQNER